MSKVSTTIKLRAAAFATAGVAFLLYPVLRPYADESTITGLGVMSTTAWVAAHLLAVVGFLLVSLALTGTARAITTAGAVLTSVYYGAETFGLFALGQRAATTPEVLQMVDAVRYHPAAITVFALGLLLLAVGAIAAARDFGRIALPYAAGFVLFLPQFFTAPPVRMAHGALLLVGCLLIARKLWKS
ncbi:hypothetical protein [Saccharothrix variisporea]|uniref:Uncharacterized protein n=1 Tax=Saccharothrix variisporea TaxID=543527 RepID=A0A495X4Y1_9PSEU|nr:hypothetical protein [Saccharothrix variisporea]RKT68987.1 hypothetical protein DFJ66_2180 [Saccharothrix variisporea]